MSERISAAEYREEIEELALEAFETMIDEDLGLDDLYDIVHEQVDGHEWIIYTDYNRQVVDHSSHPDAVHDVYGDAIPGVNLDDMTLKYAYFAMAADVNALLEEVREDIEEYLDLIEEEDFEQEAADALARVRHGLGAGD